MTFPELLATAKQWQQAGDLGRAENACREAVLLEPANAEAWCQLGSVCKAQGKYVDALPAFERAVSLDPNYAHGHNMLGIALLELGHLPHSAAAFENAIRAKPDFAIAYNNLGNVYLALGRQNDSLATYQEAVRLNPEFAEAHGNLGNVLRELGRLDEALASCRLALRLKPTFAIGHNHLGAIYSALRQWESAAGSFRQAISLNTHYLEARINLGDALRELGRLEEAEANLREALRLKPDFSETHAGLGLVLLQQNKLEAAEDACREALRLKSDGTTAHLALGMACYLQGRPEEAIACYDRALELNRDLPEGHKNRGIARLLLGDFERGWADYEWRWQCPDLSGRQLSQPLWDGSPLDGKNILLHAEQGLGDTIQFIRYAPLVRERGGRVIVACQRPLVPLLRGCGGIDELVAMGDRATMFEVHAPLMSLSRIFNTTLDNIPAAVPYIEPDARLADYWREELKSIPGFKIGITWQGSPSFRFDRLRSVPLAAFAPLVDVPGVTLVSLQKGFGSEQLAALAGRPNVVDVSPRLDETSGPFLDTAAVMKSLDLVISSDTSIAHLAGALGVPVWLAIPYSPDWRWLLGRKDSPWYPTMRLFRQEHRGNWEHVFRKIASALAAHIGVSLPARVVTIEVAPGELIDKITILEIKDQRIGDAAKLANVRAELATLVAARDRAIDSSGTLNELTAALKQVNEALWDIEDEIRVCERQGDFGPRFIELARAVYHQNDHRAALKRQINDLLGSRLIEEKSYASYVRS